MATYQVIDSFEKFDEKANINRRVELRKMDWGEIQLAGTMADGKMHPIKCPNPQELFEELKNA